jgi:signal peptidase I
MRRAACAGEVARGDLAIFRTGALERPVIKIIKAVPGDVFFVDEQGLLSVNGEVLKNSAGVDYTLPPEKMRMIELYETELGGVIPPGTYLMLGDNPRGGLDSSQIGLVDRKDIIMFGPAPSKTPSVSQTPRP